MAVVRRRYGNSGDVHNCDVERKVYVGDLSCNISDAELRHAFDQFGELHGLWIARNPPGFAFVFFKRKSDASDACRALNGRWLCGGFIKVQMASGERKRKPWMRNGVPIRKSFCSSDVCFRCGETGHYYYHCPPNRDLASLHFPVLTSPHSPSVENSLPSTRNSYRRNGNVESRCVSRRQRHRIYAGSDRYAENERYTERESYAGGERYAGRGRQSGGDRCAGSDRYAGRARWKFDFQHRAYSPQRGRNRFM